MYIDTGSPVPINIPSKLRDLEDENEKLLMVRNDSKQAYWMVICKVLFLVTIRISRWPSPQDKFKIKPSKGQHLKKLLSKTFELYERKLGP